MQFQIIVFCISLFIVLNGCRNAENNHPKDTSTTPTFDLNLSDTLTPIIVTDTTRHDTDDPAIWVNANDPKQSLIIGTDKNKDGALYVFDLAGKVIEEKTVRGLQRPNNVDIEYGLMLNGQATDIAVTTERLTHQLRIFALPSMQPIDGGGIEVFKGETGEDFRALMGIALYKDPSTQKVYAIVGRKNGPTDDYLWQYLLEDDGTGSVKATLVRKFGKYSGKNEIEAIAIDDQLGFVYYSDEGVGVRKYYAAPDSSNQELALFATTNFAEDHEGISIYAPNDTSGYIFVSDQQANQFHVYPRFENENGEQPLIAEINCSTNESDGNEVTASALGTDFPQGLFVAMSDNKTFQLYDLRMLLQLIHQAEQGVQ